MPACPQCGQPTADAAQFCAACGLRLPHAASGAASPLPPAPRWRGRRFVLWFLGIIVVIAAAFLIGTVYFIRHTTIVTSTKNGGRVETPIGVVTTSNDPNQVAKALGIPVFPGAVGEKGAQANLASNMLAALTYRTTAAPRAVINFYHVRFPDATVHEHGGSFTLVQVNGLDTMTIKAAAAGRGPAARTDIEITDVRH